MKHKVYLSALELEKKIDLNLFHDRYDVFYIHRDISEDKTAKIDDIIDLIEKSPMMKENSQVLSVKSISKTECLVLVKKNSIKPKCFKDGIIFSSKDETSQMIYNSIGSAIKVDEDGYCITNGKENKHVLEEDRIVSLLLNSLPMQREVDPKVYRNTMGHLYLDTNAKANSKEEKVCVEVSIDLYWNFHVVATLFSKRDVKSKGPFYTFYENEATKGKAVTKKGNATTGLYVHHPKVPNSKPSFPYMCKLLNGIETENFNKCKVGIFYEVLTLFNKYFGDIVKLKFQTIEAEQSVPKVINEKGHEVQSYADRNFLKKNLQTQNIQIGIYFDEELTKKEVEEIKNSDTIKWIMRYTTGKTDYPVACTIKEIKKLDQNSPTICFIHDKEWYERRKKRTDAHTRLRADGCNIQFVTYETAISKKSSKDLIEDKDEGSMECMSFVILKELLIGEDIKSGKISLFEWEKSMGSTYTLSDHWVFGMMHKDKESEFFHFLKAYKDGSFEHFRISNDINASKCKDEEVLELCDIFRKESSYFKGTPNLRIVKDSDGNIDIIVENKNTLLPIMNPEEFKNILSDKGKKEEFNNFTKETIKPTFSHILHWKRSIPGYVDGKELCFFCVGTKSYNAMGSLAKGNSVKVFYPYKRVEEEDSDILLKKLIPTFGQSQITRKNEYTVFPFVFKYIREIAMKQFDEKF